METFTVATEDAERSLRVDRYDPAEGAALGLGLVMVHGGGWRLGDPAMMALRAEIAASLGFTVFATEYRLLDEAPWPAPLEDVARVHRWVRDHAASCGVDPARVSLLGCSAGAHLSLLAAADPSNEVAAVVAFYPPTDLRGDMSERLLGEGASEAAATEVSPLCQVGERYPPTLLLHGLADAMVPPESSRSLHDRLGELGVATELHLFEGQPHEFDAGPTYCDLTQRLAATFLRRVLLESERFEDEQREHNPVFGRG